MGGEERRMSVVDIVLLLFLYILLGGCAFMFVSLGWWTFEETRLGEIFLDWVEEKLGRKEE